MQMRVQDGRDVRIARQEAPDAVVVVLDRALLPRRARVAKIDLHPVALAEQGIAHEFESTVKCHGLTAGLRQFLKMLAAKARRAFRFAPEKIAVDRFMAGMRFRFMPSANTPQSVPVTSNPVAVQQRSPADACGEVLSRDRKVSV